MWCGCCVNSMLVSELSEYILVMDSVENCPLAVTGMQCSGCSAVQPTSWEMNIRSWGSNWYLCALVPVDFVIVNACH